MAKVFEVGGELSKANVHFRPRQGQQRMAALVAQTIEDETALVVEAGTGTGKTYAYLAPALLSGKRVLVSTATKALQDQLFLRDLPRLIQLLGTPIRVALLKGRNNYLCTHRLNTHLHSGAVADRFTSNALQKVQRWAVTSRSGDLSDMPGLDQRSSVVPLITSNRDNCLGSQCPDFKTCHLQAARRDALAADLVVVNHHLFFADQAVRESGMAELLPSVDVVIFDEAHQLNEIGVLFLGTQLSSPQLLDFNRDVLAAGLQHARGLCDWSQRCSALERAIRDLRLCLPST
ncbi:MAG: ATP-dependent DNA helicase, partial [Burkholderiaceae bacterium]|nr:ATP-dependent DNA helicase [Burkholderiaceae bacterium]